MLIIGKAGVGKSYMVNAIIPNAQQKECRYGVGTTEIQRVNYDLFYDEQKVSTLRVYDTIGFLCSDRSTDEIIKNYMIMMMMQKMLI